MQKLTTENFNPLITSGKKLLLFFYNPDDAASTLSRSSIEELEGFHGLDFEIYEICASEEPEICYACSVDIIPSFLCIKDKKIHKRESMWIDATKILDLTK